MKNYSRIEEVAMRNVMHTVEWKSDVKVKQNGIDYEIDIHCALDGDEIDFNILNDTSKEYILDMILKNKKKKGEFVEVFLEPIEEEEDYPYTYC